MLGLLLFIAASHAAPAGAEGPDEDMSAPAEADPVPAYLAHCEGLPDNTAIECRRVAHSNPAICFELDHPGRKDACFHATALTLNAPENCGRVADRDLALTCAFEVSVALARKQRSMAPCRQNEQPTRRDECIYQAFLEVRDKAWCAELTDHVRRIVCETAE